MKKTDEFIGSSIISISEGIEIGKIRGFILNDAKGSIDYILVDGGLQMINTKIIPTSSIISIGEDALTINDGQAVSDITSVPEAIELLQKNITIRGSRVLTKNGRLLGEIGDIYIDENDNCNIIALEYIGNTNIKRTQIIPRNCVITFGKKMVIVTDDVEHMLLDSAIELFINKSASANKNSVKGHSNTINQAPSDNKIGFIEASLEAAANFDNAPNSSSEPNQNEDIVLPAYLSEDEIDALLHDEKTTEKEADLPEDSNKNDAADLFEKKQRQFLLGKKASKTITDNSGKIIIKEGSPITDSIIDMVKSQGKLIELVMNNSN